MLSFIKRDPHFYSTNYVSHYTIFSTWPDISLSCLVFTLEGRGDGKLGCVEVTCQKHRPHIEVRKYAMEEEEPLTRHRKREWVSVPLWENRSRGRDQNYWSRTSWSSCGVQARTINCTGKSSFFSVKVHPSWGTWFRECCHTLRQIYAQGNASFRKLFMCTESVKITLFRWYCISSKQGKLDIDIVLC